MAALPAEAVIQLVGPAFVDGDMLADVLNRPRGGGTHLNDVKVVRLMFVDGGAVCGLCWVGALDRRRRRDPWESQSARRVDSLEEGRLILWVRTT